MMATPAYCRAVIAIKQLMSFSRDLENVWFPAVGWQETINSLENDALSVQTVTKALNSIANPNTWEDQETTFRISHNKRRIIIEKGKDGTEDKKANVNFYYIDRIDCASIGDVVPNDTVSYQLSFDNYKEYLPRQKKKRKIISLIVNEKRKRKEATNHLLDESLEDRLY